MKTKPLSIETTFIIKTDRETALKICDVCESTMFEEVSISLGHKKHRVLYSYVTFKIRTTIQAVSTKRIDFTYIKRTESRFRDNFYGRISSLKCNIISVKEKTCVNFISDEYKLK